MIRVLLADSSERVLGNLSKRLHAEADLALAGTAGEGEQVVQEALRTRPDIAVIDSSLPKLDGLQATELLAQYLPRTGVILMSLESENDVFRRAMLSGAREVLQKPFKGDDFVDAIRRVHAFQERKIAAGGLRDPLGDGAAPADPPPGKLFTVVAAKGGVGASFVATNLSALLAAPRPGLTAMVDLSLQYGDVAAMLDIKTTQTVADLAAHDGVADRDLVNEVLANGPGGTKVLVAPSSPELADYVTSVHLRALLDTLRRSHDVVVADTARQLGEITLEAVEHADRVVVVTDSTVPGVKNTRLLLNVLEVLHIPEEHWVIVLNHRDAAAPLHLDRKQIEDFIKVPVTVEIPHDPAVGTSISRGTPLVLDSAAPAVTAALRSLADVLDGRAGQATPAAAAQPGQPRKRRFGFR